MKLDEIIISRAIIETFSKDLVDSLDLEVAIAGAGPAGLTAGFYLAQGGVKTAIFERSLRVGGGMPGGGIMFNKIVVQEPARKILEEMEIKHQEYEKGYYIVSSLEAVSALTYRAIRAGAKIFNLIGVEDVIVQEGRVNGFVINWGAVQLANLHVDPIGIRFKTGIDATGHDSEVIRKLEKKSRVRLATSSGKMVGEGPMWAEKGEEAILENTKEAFPGLYAAGMAANAVFGGPRMGPIFGGMLLSGRKAAQLIMKELKK